MHTFSQILQHQNSYSSHVAGHTEINTTVNISQTSWLRKWAWVRKNRNGVCRDGCPPSCKPKGSLNIVGTYQFQETRANCGTTTIKQFANLHPYLSETTGTSGITKKTIILALQTCQGNMVKTPVNSRRWQRCIYTNTQRLEIKPSQLEPLGSKCTKYNNELSRATDSKSKSHEFHA